MRGRPSVTRQSSSPVLPLIREPQGVRERAVQGERRRPAKRPGRPPQRLLEVEQTANIGGGAVWPQAQLDSVVAVAREQGF